MKSAIKPESTTRPADPSARPTDRDAPAARPATRQDGVRDTIESIIVAFILAFVFRAFVVEAFVIPTGSMAPGLFGQHGVHRCAACGYSFTYGIRENQPTATNSFGPHEFYVRCPNCDWTGDGNNHLGAGRGIAPANAGDRILVLKWCYDIGGEKLGPKRWDVVVFKDPQEGEQNYIKRLIGLPGEIIQIINGDIYVAPQDSVPADILEALAAPPPRVGMTARRLTPQQELVLAGKLKIQRKTRVAQESLWLLHYDHDYIADPSLRAEQIGYMPPTWVCLDPPGAASWNADRPCVRFDPLDGSEHWLELQGKPICDTYGYNDLNATDLPRKNNRAVGDVRVKFVLSPRGDDGEIVLMLRRGPETFYARLAANGRVSLDHEAAGIRRAGIKTADIPPLRRGEPIAISFENLDYRVSLHVDDQEVLATDDETYRPNLERLLAEPIAPDQADGRDNDAVVRIGATRMPLDIRHLVVQRDVFYRSELMAEPQTPSRLPNPFYQCRGWGTIHNPIWLRRDHPEYFCCGDNSPESKDSRLWWLIAPALQHRENFEYHHGTVPADQMIGRAFFVYWPSGFRFSENSPAVIPNLGRMRIIR